MYKRYEQLPLGLRLFIVFLFLGWLSWIPYWLSYVVYYHLPKDAPWVTKVIHKTRHFFFIATTLSVLWVSYINGTVWWHIPFILLWLLCIKIAALLDTQSRKAIYYRSALVSNLLTPISDKEIVLSDEQLRYRYNYKRLHPIFWMNFCAGGLFGHIIYLITRLLI